MSDLKKLFKRDRFYWVIVTGVMTLLVIYMIANINADGMYHTLFKIEDSIEQWQYLHEFWETHPELQRDLVLNDIPLFYVEHMMSWTVIVALIAQALRLFAQETRNRAEVQRTLPVKSHNILTCHYLSGLLTVGIPLLVQTAILRLDILYVEKNTDFIFEGKEQLWFYAGKSMINFMLIYSLLILCRKVTTDVPGTIFTFIVVEFAMQVLVGYCLGLYWSNLSDDRIRNWVFWAIVAAVWIFLSYIADQKQDYARSGVYSFTVVHWVIMGVVFANIYYLFYGSFKGLPQFEDVSKAVSFLVSAAASLLMTAGVHFVTKPKKI